jgi:diadenosine tetraphosphate (Ap4A) HIT family hydrolase
MSTVAEAVFNAFKPKKLNYELLGNGEPHLHWHIFPRHSDDPEPKKPIWLIDKSKREVRPSMEELTTMKKDLLIELEKLTG